jgi:hypothetical protein
VPLNYFTFFLPIQIHVLPNGFQYFADYLMIGAPPPHRTHTQLTTSASPAQYLLTSETPKLLHHLMFK